MVGFALWKPSPYPRQGETRIGGRHSTLEPASCDQPFLIPPCLSAALRLPRPEVPSLRDLDYPFQALCATLTARTGHTMLRSLSEGSQTHNARPRSKNVEPIPEHSGYLHTYKRDAQLSICAKGRENAVKSRTASCSLFDPTGRSARQPRTILVSATRDQSGTGLLYDNGFKCSVDSLSF